MGKPPGLAWPLLKHRPMSYRFERELDGPHDAAGTSRGAPGKRSLTDRLQRKASDVASPASAAPAPKYVDPTLGDAAFVDQLLAMPVQCRGGDAAGPEAMHALAAQGTAGSGGALPFLDQIQLAFGSHDVTGVQAHTDDRAAAAARGMGATAFATGNHVAFGGAPDLHTAAHEAAHVVQQRAGVHLAGGVGAVGDAYERHADEVADAVVRGESAELLLGPAGAPSAAIQRHAIQHKAPAKAGNAKDDSVAMLDDDDFLHAFSGYTAFSSFRSLSAGGHPVAKTAISDPKLDTALQGVRETVLAIQDDRKADHIQRALDLWGTHRAAVQAVLARADKRGADWHKDLKRAHDGFDRMETYTIDTAAQDAIDKGVKDLGGDFKVDAKLHQAEYAAARAAMIEVVQVLGKTKHLPDAANLHKQVADFDATAQIVTKHETLSESLSVAERVGIAIKGQHPLEWPRHVLRVAKAMIQGVAMLGSAVWKAKPEAGTLFRQFAERVMKDGDFAAKSSNVLGQALNVLQVAKGLYDLIGGLASGDSDRAITGARNVLSGGAGVLMTGAGAGFGASMGAAALAYIFVETIRECLNVGKLLREIPHVQEVNAVARFVEDAARVGEPGARAFAAISERYAGHTYSNNPTMQAEVQAQIEEHMRLEANKLAAGVKAKLKPSYEGRDPHSIGRYQDAIAAMGPEAVGALNYMTDNKPDDPGTVAWNAIKLFNGIGRMGQWVQVAHGTHRDNAENKKKREQLDKQSDGEWKKEEDKRRDWQRPPQGPTDEELEESMR